MRQKIFSGLALFAAFVALAVSLGAYVYSNRNNLPNEKAYLFQLIGVSVIVLICILNFVSSLKEEPETEEEPQDSRCQPDAEQQEKKEEKKKEEKKFSSTKEKKPAGKSSKKGSKKKTDKRYTKKTSKKSANKRRKKRK